MKNTAARLKSIMENHWAETDNCCWHVLWSSNIGYGYSMRKRKLAYERKLVQDKVDSFFDK